MNEIKDRVDLKKRFAKFLIQTTMNAIQMATKVIRVRILIIMLIMISLMMTQVVRMKRATMILRRMIVETRVINNLL